MKYKLKAKKGKGSGVNALPIYAIKGKGKDAFYFRDERLREYRNIRNPNDRISFDFVNNEDLKKATPQMSVYLQKAGYL